MYPPERENLVVWLGQTWPFGVIPCTDDQGNPLSGSPVSLRIASSTGTVLDAALVSDVDGNAAFRIPASETQAITPGDYLYEITAFPTNGASWGQQLGKLTVSASLFTTYPFTDQYPSGPPGPPIGIFLNYNIVQANCTLVANSRYAVDTATAIILTLPAIAGLPTGSTIEIVDLTGQAATNPITVNPSGSDTINEGAVTQVAIDRSATVKFVVAIIDDVATWQVISS